MKISEMTVHDVAHYLRLEPETFDESELQGIMTGAIRYISGHTGIPPAPADKGETLDDFADLSVAYLVLCQDMYDNRSYSQETQSGANRVVESILSLHARNLL